MLPHISANNSYIDPFDSVKANLDRQSLWRELQKLPRREPEQEWLSPDSHRPELFDVGESCQDRLLEAPTSALDPSAAWKLEPATAQAWPCSVSGRLLVIDDDETMRAVLCRILEQEGYEVAQVAQGYLGLILAEQFLPDLIILDLMLPGESGLEICRKLSSGALTRTVPILMLSARNDESDKVLGLEMGALDYVTKPFSAREIVARVKAILRYHHSMRERLEPEGSSLVGPLHIDWQQHQVRSENQVVQLNPREMQVLRVLVKSKGKAITREQIIRLAWEAEHISVRLVDLIVEQLRQKVEALSWMLLAASPGCYRLIDH